MIKLVDGEGVGAGKSFFATREVIPHLARGGTVYASDSYRLYWVRTAMYIADVYGVEIVPAQYVTIPHAEMYRVHELSQAGTADCPTLIIYDEAQEELNVHDWRSAKIRPFFDWLCQSRHDDTDVIFLTQDWKNVNSNVAKLITFRISLLNLWQMEIPGLGAIPNCWPFPQFRSVWYPKESTKSCRWNLIQHDSRLMRCYESKARRLTHKRLTMEARERFQLKKVKKKNEPMRLVIILGIIIIALYFGFKTLAGKYGKDAEWRNSAKNSFEATQGKTPTKVATSASAAESHGQPTQGEKRKLWTTRTEIFRGTDSATYIRTDKGTYEVGQMSGSGEFCLKIQGKVALCRDQFGESVYVIANDLAPQYVAKEPVPAKKEETPGKPIVANWEPHHGSGESRRLAHAGLPQKNIDSPKNSD